jgi:hypothetical protein
VSFGCDGKQCKQSTHLPLISCARCNWYWLGGWVGRRWRQRGKRSEGGGCLRMSLSVGRGGSDARRAAAGERQGKQWPHHGQ